MGAANWERALLTLKCAQTANSHKTLTIKNVQLESQHHMQRAASKYGNMYVVATSDTAQSTCHNNGVSPQKGGCIHRYRLLIHTSEWLGKNKRLDLEGSGEAKAPARARSRGRIGERSLGRQPNPFVKLLAYGQDLAPYAVIAF